MADERLRMEAEVVDKFSAPLRKLRDELNRVRPPDGVRGVEREFNRAATSAAAAAAQIRSGLSSSLSGLGLGALSAAGAVAGLVATIKNFSGATAALQAFSRETGLSVQRLRSLEALGSRFQVAPENMKAGIQNFAKNFYDIRRRHGEVWGWLRAANKDFANQLFGSKNLDEAMGRALSFIARIEDPIKRMKAAEKLFGSGVFGRLGAEGLDKLMQQWREVERDLGKLPPDAAKSAEEFERSIKSLGDTLRGFRDEAATAALKEINGALKEMNGNIRDLISGYGKFLGAIREAKEMLGNPTMGDMMKPWTWWMPSSKGRDTSAELDAARKKLSDHDAEVAKRGDAAPGVRSMWDGRRRLLEEDVKRLERALKDGVKEGLNDALIQKQSFMGGGFGGAQIMNASLGGSPLSYPRLSGGGRFNGLGGGAGSEPGAGPGGSTPGTPGASGEPRIGFSIDDGGQRVGGSRSWRNRNPGNIEYGPFAKSMGATGSDGRFAIFPSEDAGRKAQERLLFESKGYRNLTLPQAIARWAPGSENNVPAYVRAMGGDASGRRMHEYSPEERTKLLDAMKRHEGWRIGQTIGGGMAGLNVKPGAGTGHPGVLALSKMLQDAGYSKRFTAFADDFHKGRPGSLHNQGLAGDFSLNDPRRSTEARNFIRDTMRRAGIADAEAQVLDEYLNPSRGSTGGHMHFGFRTPGAAARFGAWANAQNAARDTAGLSRMGDSLMMRGAGAQKVEGDARLKIDLNGFPRGTAFSTETSGMFKSVDIDRGKTMAQAKE